jgi:hypothetical protein
MTTLASLEGSSAWESSVSEQPRSMIVLDDGRAIKSDGIDIVSIMLAVPTK